MKTVLLLTLGILGALLTSELVGEAQDLKNIERSLIECRTVFSKDLSLGYVLRISVKNTSKADIVFFKDFLPWRSPLATTLVAIPLNPSESPVLPITESIDPTVSRITLKPEELLEGEIILKKSFNKFDQLIAHKEMGIFWSFVIEDAENNRLGRYSGFSILEPPHGSQ